MRDERPRRSCHSRIGGADGPIRGVRCASRPPLFARRSAHDLAASAGPHHAGRTALPRQRRSCGASLSSGINPDPRVTLHRFDKWPCDFRPSTAARLMVDGPLTNDFDKLRAGACGANNDPDQSEGSSGAPPRGIVAAALRCLLAGELPPVAQELDAAERMRRGRSATQAEFERRLAARSALSDPSASKQLAAEIAERQEGSRLHHGGADPGRPRPSRSSARTLTTSPAGWKTSRAQEDGIRRVAERPARRARRSAGRAAAHGPEPATCDSGQAGRRAVVGAQRHPARRRRAGIARARPTCCSPT